MATRVRKLAREVERSAAEVLGLLHDLGFPRYRSTEDMIPDSIANKLRAAVGRGVRAKPVEPTDALPGEPEPTRRPVDPAPADLMSRLVPGVVKVGGAPLRARPSPQQRSQDAARPAPPTGVAEPLTSSSASVASAVPDRALEEQRAALEVQREALQQERVRLEELRITLEGLRVELAIRSADLDARRARLDAEQATLDAVRASLHGMTGGAGGTLLTELLEERGIRGLDEAQRALASPARLRALGPVLADARVSDPAVARRILADRLVLFDGEVPDDLTAVGGVTVATDRAEVPGSRVLMARLEAIGERLLLNGIRRAAFVGAPPWLQPLIRAGIDKRIDLRFRARSGSTAADAEADVTRTELVVLWNQDVAPEAQQIYDTSRAVVIVTRGGLLHLLDAVVTAMS